MCTYRYRNCKSGIRTSNGDPPVGQITGTGGSIFGRGRASGRNFPRVLGREFRGDSWPASLVGCSCWSLGGRLFFRRGGGPGCGVWPRSRECMWSLVNTHGEISLRYRMAPRSTYFPAPWLNAA